MDTFTIYQNIANQSKSSNRIILEGGKVGVKTPKALALWGRLVQACKDLFKSKSTLKANHDETVDNFRQALREKFSHKAVLAANKELQSYQISSKSLRARNVREAIKLTANSYFAEQEEQRLINQNAEKEEEQRIEQEKERIKQAFIKRNKKITPLPKIADNLIAQFSQEIKDLMTKDDLGKFSEVMSDPTAERFRKDHNLTPDEMCALVLATHNSATNEAVMNATAEGAENGKYSSLVRLLDSALTKLPAISEPVYILGAIENPSAPSNYFIDNLNEEKTFKRMWTEMFLTKNNLSQLHILNESQADKKIAIMTLSSDKGKLLNLGYSPDYGPINYVIFKQGSCHTVKNTTIFKTSDSYLMTLANRTYNMCGEKNDRPIYDNDHKLVGACLVDIEVT